MVRVYLKGGIWTNAEDEILKAAVQKYGKQQWARVASLLNKKTAKQAKARWHEWLDPSIRKTEWSRAEEEKLLHLAKLMPAQWRTIAPLVGRTATQCQEHYEALLDQAAGGGGGKQDDDDPLRQQQQHQLRPGQIDAHPETKPARPDPIDMDEDEMEMLQEARARLANTMGKKAKRKQRERMLAAAKRLADLQKRRELKQAGLLSDQILKRKNKKNKKEIDLGVEIPFYKPAPAGFHDTSSEVARSQHKLSKHLQNVDFKKVNESMYRTRDREDAIAKKRQETRMKVLEQSNQKYAAAAAAAKEQEDSAALLQRRPRGSLQLPEPAVPDTELSQLAKLQQQQQQHGGGMIGSGSAAAATTTRATQALLGDYSDRPLPTPMRTPMTASVASKTTTTAAGKTQGMSLMQQASQLRQLEQGQTPLLVSLSGTAAAATADEQDLNEEDRKQAAVAATPALPDRAGIGQTPSRRDALGLNIMDSNADDTASLGASTFATRQSSLRELARQERRAAKKARLDLEAALAALPAPQFEYELAAPDVMLDDDDGEPAASTVMTVQDQADIEAAEQEALRKKAEKLYEARSSVLKRDDLPRPSKVTAEAVMGKDEDDASNGDDEAVGLIRREVLTLMQHDAHAHPMLPLKGVDGKSKKKKKRKQDDVLMEEVVDLPPPVALDYLPEEGLQQSKDIIRQEYETLMEEKIAMVVRDGKASSREEALEFLTQETIQASVPTEKPRMIHREGKGWIEATTAADVLESLRLEFDTLQEATEALRKKNDKLESKLGVIHGGYAKRAQSMKQDILHAFGETQNAQIEETVYSLLEDQEVLGGQNRVERLEKEIKALRAAEAELQKRYGELLVAKRRAAVAAKATTNGA